MSAALIILVTLCAVFLATYAASKIAAGIYKRRWWQ